MRNELGVYRGSISGPKQWFLRVFSALNYTNYAITMMSYSELKLLLDYQPNIEYILSVHIYERYFIYLNDRINIMNKEKLLSKTNQHVLNFLCQYPNDSFYSNQLAQETGLSKGGVSQALKFLTKENLLKTENKGTMTFYQINLSSPIVRQSKVFHNIMLLNPLINKTKEYTSKAVLFGSCAEGTDSNESDIDILFISNQKQEIENIVSKFKTKRKIQLILKSPQEYISLEKKEPVFFHEIEKGKILWEK